MQFSGFAEVLRDRIGQPIEYAGTALRIGASFGIATSRAALVARHDLVRAADAALYLAKDSGRNQIVIYDRDVHQQVISVRKTAEAIRHGLEADEFVPFYQLQVDSVTHQIVGVEVLARWVRKDGQVIAPSGFLEVAEQLSLLNKIDDLITRQALSDIRQFEALKCGIPKVSFNVTAIRMIDPALVEFATCQGFRDTRISFEILESVLLDDKPEHVEFALDLMREKGLSIEIDDFGSGHASMISLIRVRPDVLKIDQRLVYGAPSSPVCRKMVQAIVDIANSLGISVTAEGVETAEHAKLCGTWAAKTSKDFILLTQ